MKKTKFSYKIPLNTYSVKPWPGEVKEMRQRGKIFRVFFVCLVWLNFWISNELYSSDDFEATELERIHSQLDEIIGEFKVDGHADYTQIEKFSEYALERLNKNNSFSSAEIDRINKGREHLIFWSKNVAKVSTIIAGGMSAALYAQKIISFSNTVQQFKKDILESEISSQELRDMIQVTRENNGRVPDYSHRTFAPLKILRLDKLFTFALNSMPSSNSTTSGFLKMATGENLLDFESEALQGFSEEIAKKSRGELKRELSNLVTPLENHLKFLQAVPGVAGTIIGIGWLCIIEGKLNRAKLDFANLQDEYTNLYGDLNRRKNVADRIAKRVAVFIRKMVDGINFLDAGAYPNSRFEINRDYADALDDVTRNLETEREDCISGAEKSRRNKEYAENKSNSYLKWATASIAVGTIVIFFPAASIGIAYAQGAALPSAGAAYASATAASLTGRVCCKKGDMLREESKKLHQESLNYVHLEQAFIHQSAVASKMLSIFMEPLTSLFDIVDNLLSSQERGLR